MNNVFFLFAAFLSGTTAIQALEFTVTENIPYLGEISDHQADLYVPQDDGEKLRPAVVVIHGGGWNGGTRLSNQHKEVCELLASNGIIAFNIDYRLTSRELEPVRDAKTAVRWLRHHSQTYKIDTSAIGGAGWSAGGWSVSYLMWTLPGDSVEMKIDDEFQTFPFDHDEMLYPEHPSTIHAGFLSSGLKFNRVRSRCWETRDDQSINSPENLPPVFVIGGDIHQGRWNEFIVEYPELGGGEIINNFHPKMKHSPELNSCSEGETPPDDCYDLRDDFVQFFIKSLNQETSNLKPLIKAKKITEPLPAIPSFDYLGRRGYKKHGYFSTP